MPMRIAPLLAVALTACVLYRPAAAADLPPEAHPSEALPPEPTPPPTWTVLAGAYIHVGATAMFTHPKTSIKLNGAPLTSAGVSIPAVYTGSAEIGYFVTPHIAVSVMGGYPPSVSAYGAGAFAPYGKLFTQVGGVALASIHYHWDLQRLHPYLGVGVGRSISFHNSANPIFENFKIGNAFAPVLVAGLDFDVTDHTSVFVDVKKIWISQKASADVTLAPSVRVPIVATIRPDPIVTTVGVGYKF